MKQHCGFEAITLKLLPIPLHIKLVELMSGETLKVPHVLPLILT